MQRGLFCLLQPVKQKGGEGRGKTHTWKHQGQEDSAARLQPFGTGERKNGGNQRPLSAITTVFRGWWKVAASLGLETVNSVSLLMSSFSCSSIESPADNY